jgi:hypothetical protein
MNLPEMNPKNLYTLAASLLGSVVLVAGIAVTVDDGNAPSPDASPSVTQSPSTTSSPSPDASKKSASPSGSTSANSKPKSSTPTRTQTPGGSSTTPSTNPNDLSHCPDGDLCPGYDGSGLSDLGKLISSLTMEPEVTDGYDREAFSYNSSTTRDKVLAQEKRADGTWLSIWDNKVTNNASDLEIDHTVALKEAWDSGAFKWSADKRKAFANDTSHPETLNAITASLNQSKSAQDGVWAAPFERCEYVRQVTVIKKTWGLSVDEVERDRMMAISEECYGSDN